MIKKLIKYRFVLEMVSKYYVPFLLFTNLIIDLNVGSWWHKKYLVGIMEFTSYGIIVLFGMFIEGIVRSKCIWFNLSLVGLLYNNILNLTYQPYYSDEYVSLVRVAPTLVIMLFVVVFIIKDEWKS